MKWMVCLSLTALAYGADVQVKQGTPVRLELQKTVSSATAQLNDRIEFSVTDNVVLDGATVIPKGSLAWGVVTEAAPKGRMARSGRLGINLDTVCLANGQKAGLRAIQDMDNPGAHKYEHPDSSVAGSLLAFPAWPVLLFMNGKDITVSQGAQFTAFLSRDLAFDPAFKAKATCGDRTEVAEGAPFDPSTVTVKSNPAGAEITVDGKFVGNTPTVLRLEPGDHAVAVAMSGHEAWRRLVTVRPGGDVTLSATLAARAQ